LGFNKRAHGDGVGIRPATSFSRSKDKEFNIAVTGVAELDPSLQELASEFGPKGINAAMRKACRAAIKEIVLPAVLARMPWDTGYLESQVVVRAIPRSRNRMGYWVGFPDPLFQGDTFYGGFIEFGWDHRLGVTVEADSFLRKALYENADAVMTKVRHYLEDWVRHVSDKAV
jgi:hypothetical protein